MPKKRTAVKKKAWIGVDPGKNGALALVTEDNEVQITDVDGDAHNILNWIKEQKDAYDIQIAALEHVHSMPRDSGKSAFTFGRWCGMIEMALIAEGIGYEKVTPTKWKRGLIKKEDGRDKAASINVAKRLFPNHADLFKRKKDHNRAEALLIAVWARRNL